MLLALVFVVCGSPRLSAQTLGPNLGSLTHSLTRVGYTCTNSSGGRGSYSEFRLTNFVYTPTSGVSGGNQSLAGTAFYVITSTGGGGTCLPVGPHPVELSGTGYTIEVVPSSNGSATSTISIPGYVNPKYIVVGILYAPPGGVVKSGVASGNVDYSDSNLVSSTITTKNSFGSSYKESNVATLSAGLNILGWAGGSVSGGVTSSLTTSTTTTDSTAVTVQKTSGTVIGVNGPECPYVGVDHDYDIIEVWLNPVQLFTLTNSGATSTSMSYVQPSGYGYSTLDQPGTDVYQVYAGELNGDLPVRSSTTKAFARAWAASEVWPSGQGPGLTAQDEQTILQTDPYWDCTYQSPWTDTGTTACAKPPDATRFTESAGDQNFLYTQPDPGGSPNFKTYYFSYTNTDTLGSSVAFASSQTNGYEVTFKDSVFGVGFSDTLSESWTTTNTYETSSQFKNSNTTTATATIWQPPCNVVSGVCSPIYPPSTAYNPITCAAINTLPLAFGQGDQFYIYQDNLFGTFLMEPYLEGQ
jgi:hypothetical protein